MDRKSFIFYKDWRDAIKDLQDSVRLEVYDAIIEYGLTGIQPKLKPIANVAFNFIKPQLDRNNERYQNGCQGAEHGKKGGRPPKNKPHKNPIKTPNDNVNDNDIKKEIKKEKDFEVDLKGEKKTVLSTLYPMMQEMLTDQLSLERLCMNNRLDISELKDFVIEFFVLRTNENNTAIQTLNDAQRYFGNWLRTQLERTFNQKKDNHNDSSSGKLHPALQQ